MDRTIGVFASFLAALVLSGCRTNEWYNGHCEKSGDCAQQPGFGKVCVLRRCQECGLDKDCKAGFGCRELRCVPRPECEVPIDCPAGKTCDMGKCVDASSAPQPSHPPGSPAR